MRNWNFDRRRKPPCPRVSFSALIVALLILAPSVLRAADDDAAEKPAVEVGKPSGIVLEPKSFELIGARSQQQLAVTGQYGSTESPFLKLCSIADGVLLE